MLPSRRRTGRQPPTLAATARAGPAAEFIYSRLDQGWLRNLDRSASAIERTRRRNQAHLDSGRLRLQHGELRDLDVPAGSVDVYGPGAAGSDQQRVLARVRDAVAASPFRSSSAWAEPRGAGVITQRPGP